MLSNVGSNLGLLYARQSPWTPQVLFLGGGGGVSRKLYKFSSCLQTRNTSRDCSHLALLCSPCVLQEISECSERSHNPVPSKAAEKPCCFSSMPPSQCEQGHLSSKHSADHCEPAGQGVSASGSLGAHSSHRFTYTDAYMHTYSFILLCHVCSLPVSLNSVIICKFSSISDIP